MKNKLKLLPLLLVLNFSFINSVLADDLKIQSSVLNKYVNSALSDLSSKEFITSAIKTCYGQFGFSYESIKNIINILSSNYETNLEVLSKKLRKDIEQKDFEIIYQKYKSGSYERRFNLFKRFVKGPVVADIGCGTGDLSEAIIQNIPSVKKIIATDIEEYHKKITNPSIEFKPQLQHDKIPIDSNAVDTVLLIYVLHHVEECCQESLLKEINRILKKGGKVVILEDTYSDSLRPEYERKLMNFFLELDDGQKKEVLAFNDWLTNMLRGISIIMSFNFRSIEDWESCFNKVGFSVKHKQFLGIPKNSISFAPRGVLILEKISNISSEEKLPAN